MTCSSSLADRFLMFCVRGSSCGKVLAKRSAEEIIRDICESVSVGLRDGTIFEDEDEEEEIVGGVPKAGVVRLQKP